MHALIPVVGYHCAKTVHILWIIGHIVSPARLVSVARILVKFLRNVTLAPTPLGGELYAKPVLLELMQTTLAL